MKKIVLFLSLSFSAILVAQNSNPTIKTSGRHILGPCNDTLKLRGINYAPYNWGYTLSDLKIDEIAKTGANVVRMPWYVNNTAPVYTNYVALDSALSKCIQKKMIAIIELHDYTCGDTPSSLIAGAAWFTNSNVLPLLLKYKHSVIINIANEALKVNWASNPTTALATYKNTYQTIITNLRNVSSFTFPLMIDAPDCGQHSDAFITSNTATDLINYDPQHNIIFSAHAYWYGYASDSTQMATKLNNINAQNIPFVLGEIANLQDDATMCQYTLNYKALLNYCTLKKVNWLAWSWDHDDCSARQVSTGGSFSSLTPYGNDIVNNATYGLLTHSPAKSKFLVNNQICTIPTGIAESSADNELVLFPNPGNGHFSVKSLQAIKSISATDLLGNSIPVEKTTGSSFKLNSRNGVYFVTLLTENNHSKTIKLILNGTASE